MILRLCLLLSLLCAALPAQQDATFRVGTWNLEFLGADPKFRRDTAPRTDDDRRAIGRRIRELSVCVLGVQEISGEAVMQQVAAAAGPSWRFVLGTTGQWDDGRTQQGVGFFYDEARVELLHAEELLQFPREKDGVSVFHRKPVTACFRHRETGCDFRCVVVHLKAGRKARDLEKRRVEAATLREWLDGLLRDDAEDHDVVLLGDFNSSYGDEPERILEAGGAFRYLDQPRPSPTILHFDAPIDQLCVAAAFAEVVRDSLVVHGVDGDAERRAYRKTYSDHFPVTAALRARGDDDPDARFRRGPAAQRLPAASRPVTPNWPWPADTPVQVLVDSVRHEGRLVTMSGPWVVIENDSGTVAFPIANVTWVRAVR